MKNHLETHGLHSVNLNSGDLHDMIGSGHVLKQTVEPPTGLLEESVVAMDAEQEQHEHLLLAFRGLHCAGCANLA